ncbi:MAG: Two component signal transduction histidine kinase, partial [Acidimicrobiia bacterium]|nr:Two component signal transduction histidine kinase [Acidimicrobiia bacterium]
MGDPPVRRPHGGYGGRYAPIVGAATAASDATGTQRAALRGRRRGKVLVVLAVGLVITAVAAIGTQVLHDQTEDRLLKQSTREAATLFSVSVARNQSALAVAGRLVADGLDAQRFQDVMQPLTGRDQPFAGVSVWSTAGPAPQLLVSIGDPLVLPGLGRSRIAEVLSRATTTPDKLSVASLIKEQPSRIGYSFMASQAGTRLVVYAEGAVPAQKTAVPRTDAAFRELDYALYLNNETPDGLVVSSLAHPPITSRRAVATTPFGDARLLLVTTPKGTLAGDFSRWLPWVVAGFGLLITAAAGGVADRMLRRRDEAFLLADDNSRLYAEQRQIAETLQRNLLPQRLPTPPGTAVAARYWPAGVASQVGGDFYDLFPLADGSWALVIGDVCGKGIEAAALTSVARHTIRAAAQHLTSPAKVLRWVHDAVLAFDPTTYCTACYGVLRLGPDGVPNRFEFALGGHAGPLLVSRDDDVPRSIGAPGTLLGMISDPVIVDSVVDLHPGDMLFLYTDGFTDAP